MRPGAAVGLARPATMALVLLLTLAAIADLWRCAIGLTLATGAARIAVLATAGASAAVLSGGAAVGAVRRRAWSGWVGVLVGVASAPQAAQTGFRPPYLIPDAATVVLGLLVLITVLTGVQGDAGSGDGADGGCGAQAAAFESARLLLGNPAEGECDERGRAGGEHR